MFHIHRCFRDRLRHVSYQTTCQRPSPSCSISTDVSETVYVMFHINRRFRDRLRQCFISTDVSETVSVMFHINRRFRDRLRHVPKPPTFQRPFPSCSVSTDVSETVSVMFQINRRFRDSLRLHHQVPDINDFMFFWRCVCRLWYELRYTDMLSTVRFTACLWYHAIFSVHTDVSFYGVDPTRLLLSAMDIMLNVVTAAFYVDRFHAAVQLPTCCPKGMFGCPSTYLLHYLQ
jgi:hypothetical protein